MTSKAIKQFPKAWQLWEEVNLRASATGQDPARARQEFESNLASLKEFVTKRREWLLAQEEIRNSGSPPQKITDP